MVVAQVVQMQIGRKEWWELAGDGRSLDKQLLGDARGLLRRKGGSDKSKRCEGALCDEFLDRPSLPRLRQRHISRKLWTLLLNGHDANVCVQKREGSFFDGAMLQLRQYN